MKRLAAMAVVALAACSDGPSGGSPQAAARDDPQAISEQLGCDDFAEEETEQLYVRSLYRCTADTAVYTFNSSDARDSWRAVAEGFGTVVLDEGDDWLQVKD